MRITIWQDVRRLWPGLLGLVVFAIALWAQTDALAGVFYDDGIYLSLARSLAEGEGFRYGHLPGDPAGVRYPFLYPYVLSFLWRVWPSFPANLALFSLFDSAVYGLSAFVIARSVARLSLPGLSVGLVLVAAFAAFPLLAIVGVRFSEPLFLILFSGSLLIADGGEATTKRAVAAGLLAGLATLTRSLGLAGLLGIAISLWYRGARRSSLVSLAAGTVVILPWIIWLLVHSGELDPRLTSVYGTYSEGSGGMGLIQFIGGASLQVFSPIARLLLPALPTPLWALAAVCISLLIVWGAARTFRVLPALIVTLGLYASVVTVWPYTPDRFVWVVLPWIFLLMAVALHDLWTRNRYWKLVVGAAALVIGIGFLPREISSLRNRGFASTAEGISQPLRLLISSIVQELPSDAVIAGGDEALLSLYTGRSSVPSYLSRLNGRDEIPLTPAESVHFYCATGVTHIALSGPGAPAARLLQTLSTAEVSPLEQLFSVREGPKLYRFTCPD